MMNQRINFTKQTFVRKGVNSSANKQHNYISISKEKSKSESKNQSKKIKIFFQKDIIMPLKKVIKSKKDIQNDSLNSCKFSLPTLQKNSNRLKLSNVILKTKNYQQSGISIENQSKKILSPFKLLKGPSLSSHHRQKFQQNSNIRDSHENSTITQKKQSPIIQQRLEIKIKLPYKNQNQNQHIINEENKEFFNFKTNFSSNLYKASAFQLQSVFSIVIKSKVQKISYQCQTQTFQQQYYEDFLKFKQIFSQSFGKLQKIVHEYNNQQHSKRNQKLNDKIIINKIVKSLIDQDESESSLQRQDRVIVLQSEIEEVRKEMLRAFNQLKKQDFHQQSEGKNNSQSDIEAPNNYSILKYFQSKFNQWRSLIYENKILISNCVKQLEEIPELLLKVFQKDEYSISKNSLVTEQQKVRDFLNIKCLKCFQTNRNISYLQQKCQKVEPAINALQKLLKISKK